MRRSVYHLLLLFFLSRMLLGQTSSPSAVKAPAPTPAASPTMEDLVSSLALADLQTALSFIKNNFTNPEATNETELDRATLEGLLFRQPNGLMILAEREAASPDLAIYAEILDGHVGYLRIGSLSNTNLKALDRKLTEFTSKKVDAIILDLRASNQPSADFGTAAEFAKRFCPRGKLLFKLRKASTHQERTFESDRDPTFAGLVVALTDDETVGAAEAFAAALRLDDRALTIGQVTAGRAVEYSDLPLPGGKILRVATSEVVLADGQSLFPSGIKPDLPVQMSIADKRQIFQLSNEKGMSAFISEAERPHLNEAALLAGTNPELDIPDARHSGGKTKQPSRDAVLQRALDVLTSLEIYQKR